MLELMDHHLVAQQEPLKAALAQLVRIPSMCDEGGGGYPFGQAIDQALRQALQIAGELGIKTHYDNRGFYGYAEIGEGQEMLGILGHLDVVPPAKLEDWKYRPFDPVEKDGILYGRGAQDDIGPMLAALFAVKALLDAGVKHLCIALRAIGIQSRAINFVAREIGEDPYAPRIFGECADEPSGKLKFNIGKIELGDMERLYIDSRLPVTVPKEEVVARLSTAATKFGLEYKEADWLAPIYLPLDHFMLTTLMKGYQQISGDTQTKPMGSGGATYARAMPNCVAYGALMTDELLTEHQPNERIDLQNLFLAMKIYAHAVCQCIN